MWLPDYIAVTVVRLSKGYVFTYVDFISDVNRKEAIIKALNRLVVSGKTGTMQKVDLYRPETTAFSCLQSGMAM